MQWMDLLQYEPIARVHAADQPQSIGPAAGLARSKSIEVIEEARLRDQDMGEWQGRPWDELVAADRVAVTEFFERFADQVPPGGESLGQAVERMIEWWGDSRPEEPGHAIAAVGPGSLLSGFAAALLGMRLSRCLSLSLPPGGVGVLDVYSNGVRVSAWNVDGLRDEGGTADAAGTE